MFRCGRGTYQAAHFYTLDDEGIERFNAIAKGDVNDHSFVIAARAARRAARFAVDCNFKTRDPDNVQQLGAMYGMLRCP